MIQFRSVTKKYKNDHYALKNINLDIMSGEFVFIVGASGAGKSTLMKLLYNEERPTSGTVTIGGINIANLSNDKVPNLRRCMGIVFQDFRLIPTMTVYDNVAFAMRVVGAREKDIRKRVPYVINIVGLSAKARNYPNELSGGEQQRVALARALANNADIIIADEPTGNVDPQMSLEIVELLTRLNEAGTTVIMVTHAHDLVKKFDKRVITLESGEVVADGMIENGELPVQSAAHLNLEKQTIEEKYSSKEEEAKPEEKKEEKVDEDFLDAIISDNDSYRIYLEQDSEKEGENQ